MADRGTVYAIQDAEQVECDTYAHPTEPTADWGSQFNAVYYGPW